MKLFIIICFGLFIISNCQELDSERKYYCNQATFIKVRCLKKEPVKVIEDINELWSALAKSNREENKSILSKNERKKLFLNSKKKKPKNWLIYYYSLQFEKPNFYAFTTLTYSEAKFIALTLYSFNCITGELVDEILVYEHYLEGGAVENKKTIFDSTGFRIEATKFDSISFKKYTFNLAGEIILIH